MEDHQFINRVKRDSPFKRSAAVLLLGKMKIERDELYKKIWSRPMTQVAGEYGLSDNGLRKICRKLNIPWPPRGYWQKLAHNKKTKKAPLPALKEEVPIVIERKDPVKRLVKENEPEYILAEYLPENQIQVLDKLLNPHPLIASLKKTTDLKRQDSKGLVWSKKGELDIHVTPQSFDRTLRIMDALIKALEARRIKVAVNAREEKTPTYVVIKGETLPFDLYETIKQTKKEQPDRFGFDQYEYVPTGILVLRIKDVWNVRHEWKDGKEKILEQLLNSFIRGLYKAADYKNYWTLERERRDREFKEAYLKQEEQQRLQALELEKRKQLEAEAVNWQKSKILRAYIAEKRDKHIEQRGPIEAGSEMDKWIAWASQHVDNLNHW